MKVPPDAATLLELLMNMRTVTALALGVIAPSAWAQRVTVGAKAPELRVGRWLGEQREVAKPRRGRVVVFWSAAAADSRQTLRAVSRLHRSYARQGIETRLIATGPVKAVEDALAAKPKPGIAAGLDESGTNAAAWLGAAPPPMPIAFVVDAPGRIRWFGHPDSVVPAIEDVVHAQKDAAFDRFRGFMQLRIQAAQNKREWDEAIRLADDLIGYSSSRAEGWQRKLATCLMAKRRDQCKDTASEALAALANRSDELVRFVTDLVAVAHDAEDLAGALRALRRATRTGGDGVHVRTCLLKVARKAKRDAIAAEAALWLAEHVGPDGEALVAIADLLATAAKPEEFRKPAVTLVAKLRELPPAIPTLYAEFDLLHTCLGDLDGARAVGRRMIEKMVRDDGGLNSFAWRLLTYPHRKGKFPKLALMAADLIGKKTGKKLTYYMLDTVALAKFENGLIDEAIALQKKAIAGGRGTNAYRDRLARYEAAKRKR